MKHASLPLLRWMAPLRHLGAKVLVGREPPANREPSMNEITTVGLDLAKHVFQVHGVDAAGATVLRKQLRRAQVLAFFSRLPRRARRHRAGAGASERAGCSATRRDYCAFDAGCRRVEGG